jgi:hypothetical protein
MKLLLIAALLVISKTSFADCDCLIVPFPKSCTKECMGRVLAKADYIQLTKSIGLSSSTSSKISNFPGREKVTTIDTFEKVLNRQQMAEAKEKLSRIDSKTVTTIFKSSSFKP